MAAEGLHEREDAETQPKYNISDNRNSNPGAYNYNARKSVLSMTSGAHACI